MTTWRIEIAEEMARHGDDWENVETWAADVATAAEFLDKPFDNYYGPCNGIPFTVWTNNRVYFPTSYDGLEACSSVARNPDQKPTDHIGQRE